MGTKLGINWYLGDAQKMGAITKKKLASGGVSFIARVRKQDVGSISKAFACRAEARAWIRSVENGMGEGGKIALPRKKNGTLTFYGAVALYAARENPNDKGVLYFGRWRDALGDVALSKITPVVINRVVEGWRESFAHVTLNIHITKLSVLFKRLREWGVADSNPARDARKFTPPRGRVRFLTEDERKALLNVCKKSPCKSLYLIVLLALSTGMRKEEILSLRWEMVNLEGGVISLENTKNGERRGVPIVPACGSLLKKRKGKKKEGWVFPGEKESPKRKDCTPVNPEDRHFDIRKPWEAALKKASINDFRFHDLRHSCASYLAMNGATSLEIAEVLGHKSLSMVKRYAHLSDNHVASVVQKMTKKFGIA